MTPCAALALAALTSSEILPHHDRSAAVLAAAHTLLRALSTGRKIDSSVMRGAMEHAFGGSAAEGLWSWKDAYEAVEAAQVLFLRQFGASIIRAGHSAAGVLAILEKLGSLLPIETRRSETRAFSSEVDTGSREENALKQGDRAFLVTRSSLETL